MTAAFVRHIPCVVHILSASFSFSEAIIYAGSWVSYPGTSSSYDVTGVVTVKPGITSSGVDTQLLAWELEGVDPACPTGAQNDCGIHIHSGTTCLDANLVGGHLYNTPTDPWTSVRYSASANNRTVQETAIELVTDLVSDEIKDKVIVVHDSEGLRVSCSKMTSENPVSIETSADLYVSSFVTYPGSSYEGNVTGYIKLAADDGDVPGQVVSWDLQGLDSKCPSKDEKNICGIHIHYGTTCDAHETIAGHFYATSSDPWVPVRYEAVDDGKSKVSAGVRVVTGLTQRQILGRVVVVHNSENAGDRIACGVITKMEPSATTTTTTDDKIAGGEAATAWRKSIPWLPTFNVAAALMFVSAI